MARRIEQLLAKYDLPPDADQGAIEARREEQIRIYHPDSTPEASPEVRQHLKAHLDQVQADFKAMLEARRKGAAPDPPDPGARLGAAIEEPSRAPATGPMTRLKNLDVKTVRIAVAALIAIAVLILLATTVLGGDGDSPPVDEKALKAGDPVGLSESQLTDEASSLPHAAFWLGPRDSVSQYELTSTKDGRIFIRYLSDGAKVGDPRSIFLTVGTYEIPDAAAALRKAAQSNGQRVMHRGGDLTLTGGKAGNAYVVFADQPDLQVEIYSPVPGEADSLVKSGAVVPLG